MESEAEKMERLATWRRLFFLGGGGGGVQGWVQGLGLGFGVWGLGFGVWGGLWSLRVSEFACLGFGVAARGGIHPTHHERVLKGGGGSTLEHHEVSVQHLGSLT